MPTDYQDESDLKYIDGLDEIPLSGPDPFEPDDKLEAAEFGEAKLEADVNSGREITAPTRLHAKAATAWASYILFYGGEAPTSALSGQIVEGSDADLMEFAKENENVYEKTVSSIRQTDDETQPDEVDFQVFDL